MLPLSIRGCAQTLSARSPACQGVAGTQFALLQPARFDAARIYSLNSFDSASNDGNPNDSRGEFN
jgi:hypothetical protein